METNGRSSCTGNLQCINVHYLFINESIEKGEVKVEYCPTHIMLVDLFTNMLMEKRFREFIWVIMGFKSIFNLDSSILHSIKECVGIFLKRKS